MNWKYLTTFQLLNDSERELFRDLSNKILNGTRTISRNLTGFYSDIPKSVKVGTLAAASLAAGVYLGNHLAKHSFHSFKKPEDRYDVHYYLPAEPHGRQQMEYIFGTVSSETLEGLIRSQGYGGIQDLKITRIIREE